MSSTLVLNCWDDPDNTFTVEISPIKNVFHLKDETKERNKPLFDHVDAHTLVVWQVSIAFDDDYDENMEVII